MEGVAGPSEGSEWGGAGLPASSRELWGPGPLSSRTPGYRTREELGLVRDWQGAFCAQTTRGLQQMLMGGVSTGTPIPLAAVRPAAQLGYSC